MEILVSCTDMKTLVMKLGLLGLLVDLDDSVTSRISASDDKANPAKSLKKLGGAKKPNFGVRIGPKTFDDSFGSIFVSYITFNHSLVPCLIFENVLSSMIRSYFDGMRYGVGTKG